MKTSGGQIAPPLSQGELAVWYGTRVQPRGHFAAWEQPEYFVSELRDGFKSLR
jgi:hypothetical protein